SFVLPVVSDIVYELAAEPEPVAEPSRARFEPTVFDTPSVYESPNESVGVEGGLWVGQPRANPRVSPATTGLVNVAPQLAALQLETYFFWTSDGEEPTETEFEAPSEKVLPRVSVGVEGGPCPDHPTPKARMFP